MVDTVPDDFSPVLGIADAEGLEDAPDGRIELEGLPNTRDIGGIPAADGRYVKHARLLRSGALDGATARDLAVLADDYNLRTVVDLRTEEERREKPDPEDELMGVRFENAPVLNTSTLGVTREGGIKGALKMLRAVQDNPAQIMMDIYERMVLDEASQRGFASFFDDVLATEEGSVLWHCTIGKDRAGLATMLMLHVLGASRDDIMKDYQATNRYVASRTEDIANALATYHLAGKLDASIQVINSADPRFMQAALDAIEKEYGGLDAYVERAVGVSGEKKASLREQYLTDDPQG
ncbi:protein-tyrosine-phosphatase [Gordonibacter sp. 28C]|uniref:tyrosine-protein phosphatase n=1 Tax=Gordonibacter sp. 28C TaxID=2078569 RepID=UPI000DF756B0|nr:tyrosine-protein phosphatase [Gordonibacter sp. 28C]RDB64453.1 protein-tyrosine-phosphatase [Gordonibacter sp. 28C]